MDNVVSKNRLAELFSEGFISPKLTEWLDWTAGKVATHFVALPMIQRGSVWKPSQIITLWDSLLRGMPIGSLLLSRLGSTDKGNPIQVIRVGSKQLMDVPASGGAALLDGQQRTLAMLLGWPHSSAEQVQPRTLWVDLADKPARDHLFRMHVTSTAHPYGYTKADPNARLSLRDRREARPDPITNVSASARQFPWDSHFPLRLTDLIQSFMDAGQDPARWKDSILSQLRQAPAHRGKSWQDFDSNREKWDTLKAVDQFGERLQVLFKLKIPLIAVPDSCFTENSAQDGEDPALAVLFKRVGTGGTDLSNADYVYSVIKHHLPQAFQLVESIAAHKGFAQLLGPTDIVMTAVRLVAAESGMTDFENPNMGNFDSLRKDPEFLQTFLKLVSSDRLTRALDMLTEGLKFKAERGDADPGLPMHAFILVSRPVLQILLRWLLSATKACAGDAAQERQVLEQSRDEILRFVLYASVALQDVQRASTWAFAWIKDNEGSRVGTFPGRELVRFLIKRSVTENREVALPLASKEDFASLAISTPLEESRPVLGWERFLPKDEFKRVAAKVFQQWWGNRDRHQHALLLWLQRPYVDRIDKNPNEVRSDDEVPYDYDHICPSNHWGNWTGITSKDRLLDFLASDSNKGHFHVGNSIGNLRVWYASHNRRDGDAPAAEKLNLNDREVGEDKGVLLKDSAIAPEHSHLWNACSAEGSGTVWTPTRARAFQSAVETRTCDLYSRFIDELNFQEWFPLSSTQITQ